MLEGGIREGQFGIRKAEFGKPKAKAGRHKFLIPDALHHPGERRASGTWNDGSGSLQNVRRGHSGDQRESRIVLENKIRKAEGGRRKAESGKRKVEEGILLVT
jgi:hypothetical protein